MTRRRALAWWQVLACWAACALLVWLDRAGGPLALRHTAPISEAAVFGFIVQGIALIGGWLGTAAAAVASYLAAVVQWLAIHLAIFIQATGAVFAKAWDALKIVYSDVLKPAVQWFDTNIKRLYGWLRDTFRPVFDFLNRVRGELLDAYKHFVRPVLDIIDYTRAGLRILGDLGVDWARALDARLGQYESLISENFRRILSYVNEAIDVLNSIVTVDRLFQRLPFLRTLMRDTRFVWRVMVNARARPTTGDDTYWVERATVIRTVPEVTADMQAFLDGNESAIGPVVEMFTDRWSEYLGNG